jgi:hypothetical protein
MVILLAAAACACAVAVPTAIGLSSNPTFNQRIPVRAPSAAHVITFDDHGQAVEKEASRRVLPRTSTPTPRTSPTGVRSSEPGDDRSTREPGGGRPSSAGRSDGATDDSGHGGSGRGGSGGSDHSGGSDDSGGHGGSDDSGGHGGGSDH